MALSLEIIPGILALLLIPLSLFLLYIRPSSPIPNPTCPPWQYNLVFTLALLYAVAGSVDLGAAVKATSVGDDRGNQLSVAASVLNDLVMAGVEVALLLFLGLNVVPMLSPSVLRLHNIVYAIIVAAAAIVSLLNSAQAVHTMPVFMMPSIALMSTLFPLPLLVYMIIKSPLSVTHEVSRQVWVALLCAQMEGVASTVFSFFSGVAYRIAECAFMVFWIGGVMIVYHVLAFPKEFGEAEMTSLPTSMPNTPLEKSFSIADHLPVSPSPTPPISFPSVPRRSSSMCSSTSAKWIRAKNEHTDSRPSSSRSASSQVPCIAKGEDAPAVTSALSPVEDVRMDYEAALVSELMKSEMRKQSSSTPPTTLSNTPVVPFIRRKLSGSSIDTERPIDLTPPAPPTPSVPRTPTVTRHRSREYQVFRRVSIPPRQKPSSPLSATGPTPPREYPVFRRLSIPPRQRPTSSLSSTAHNRTSSRSRRHRRTSSAGVESTGKQNDPEIVVPPVLEHKSPTLTES